MTHTHTYVTLEVSQASFDEIKGKLIAAAYSHCVGADDGRECIDLTGIELVPRVDE
jgi:hypothetical protein